MTQYFLYFDGTIYFDQWVHRLISVNVLLELSANFLNFSVPVHFVNIQTG